MDMSQLFRGKAAVLVYAGKRVSQIDVDDLISVFYLWAEMVDVFLYIDCCGFGECFVVVIFLIDFFRCDIYIIPVLLFIQYDMQGKIVDIITYF